MKQLSQAETVLIISYINQETSTSASAIEEINASSTLKPEQLPEYYEKNLKEHSNFFHSTDTSFNMNTLYFSIKKSKIYFAIQYLKEEPQNM